MKNSTRIFLLVLLFVSVQVVGQVKLTWQAEYATVRHRVLTDNAHNGYTGAGFTDFINETGSFIEFKVNAPEAGTFKLSVKYASGSGDRQLNVRVNGVLVKDKFNFPSTVEWNKWNTLSFNVNLTKTSSIKLESPNATGGPNIDFILLENASMKGNFAPVAMNDTLSSTMNQPITIPVLYNDLELNGEQLAITNLGTAANGAVTLLSNNSIRYTPKNNFQGKDVFSYTVSDGVHQSTAKAVVTVTNMDWSIRFADMILQTKTPASLGSWDYTVGLLLEGMLRVYKRTGDARYLNFVNQWGLLHVSETGVIDNHINSLDNMMPGFTLLHLYQITKNNRYKLAADKMRANYATYPRTSDKGFWHNKSTEGQLWLDGLYMSTPFIATYGSLFNQKEWAYSEVITQYKTYISHLKNNASGILVHAYDQDGSAPWAQKPLNRSPHHWGRSIGWVMMGLMEVTDIIPENHPDKKSIIDIYTSVLKELVRYQDKNTGLWYQVVDKGSDSRNWLETSCTMMFALGMKRAIEKGYLPASYNQYADLAYAGVLSKVSLDGNGRAKLTDICMGTNVSSDINYYLDRSRATNDRHGVGTFLIMNEYFAHDNLPWLANQLPVVTLTAPANNSTFTSIPASITITAAATDADGTIAKVEFFNGTTKLGEKISAPYTYTWTGVAGGTYSITAKATDNKGGTSASAARTVTVSTVVNQTPVVSLTSPAQNAGYIAPANIPIAASASDSDGSIAKVEFFSGATKLGEKTTSPYSYTWNGVAAGTYTITAKATDNKGSVTTSGARTVTVTAPSNVCSSLASYKESNAYVAGSKVKNGNSRYECKPWPNSGWCNGAAWAYAPGTGSYWSDAWILLGSCSARTENESTLAEGLLTNVPNPFTESTEITLHVAEAGNVSVDVYDKTAQLVKSIHDGYLAVGDYRFSFDGSQLNAGVYVVLVKTSSGSAQQKMIKLE